ncbi:hypothetical protein [Blastochloris sulfoviridis]|uniref:Uncharacterized protein n=1 Tax=Blastochloris sulfoviridis TaxID=50712 RepID=A0A5M6I5M0_9HYPH|nr:hypothetical protein [Blastochloris sulfoviridis]KAA5603137.1 hypothetical protein F1193_02635 [Blastochloris sulfoviridis]
MQIEIPGEPKLWQPVPPPQQVSLPLEARTRIGVLGGLLIFPALVLAAGMVFGAAIMIQLLATGEIGSAGEAVVAVLLAVFSGVTSVTVLGAVVTLLADRWRNAPLVIDAGSIRDGRLRLAPVPWSDVAHAWAVQNGSPARGIDIKGVGLELRRPVSACHDPYRLGVIMFRWWQPQPGETWISRNQPILFFLTGGLVRRHPRDNEIYIPIECLSVRRHVLVHTIAALVRQHGGSVDIL